MGRSIGIDLGTTNSCAAVIENNQPRIIMYRGGSYTIPSLFAIDDTGRMLVGHDAKKQAALNPQDTVVATKRLIGRSFHSPQVEKIRQLFTYDMVEGKEGEVLIKVKDKLLDLREISAQILRKIKQVAEEYLQEEVSNAVITVPAYFNDKQRQAVRQAGKLAEMNVLRILNEPTAAALAYGLGKNLKQRLAVYDLGGGTFDISIIEIRDKVFEVVATGGDTFLGGIDWDDRIMGWSMERFMEQTGIDLSYDRVALQRLREASEHTKISLSTVKDAKMEVPFIARGTKGILNLDLQMNRDKLEEITGDLVERTVQACDRIFGEAKMTPKDIDEVLLVGGMSRMPLVQKRVREWFGRDPCKGVHPDEAVAVGAAIMAHSLSQSSGQKVTLLDVLPMPIGIAKVDQSFLPLFPKNCPIPHVRRMTLTNSKDDQKTIMLKIYQGDSDIAAENELLGTFVFSGIRSLPRGHVKLDVWLNIDSEGILSVSAKDKDNDQPVDVHLKLKNKTLRPRLTLQTESRGGEIMGAEAAEQKRLEAERKAREIAKSLEADASGFDSHDKMGAVPSTAGADHSDSGFSKSEPPSSKSDDGDRRRKGKGIVVQASPDKPRTDPAAQRPEASPPRKQSVPSARVPEPKVAVESVKSAGPSPAKEVAPDAVPAEAKGGGDAKEPQVPATTAAAASAARMRGCLTTFFGFFWKKK